MHASIFLAALSLALPATNEQEPVSLPIARRVQALSPLQLAQKSIQHTFNKYAKAKGLPKYSAPFLGTAPLQNALNQLYVCNVTIGNGQVLPLDLDTGSADTWVRGKGCASTDGSCDDKFAHVDMGDSSLTDTGKTYQVSYGSGSVNGKIYNAPVAIGSYKATYPIGISTKEQGFSDGYEAGLMGLGFNAISQISQAVGSNANFFDGLGLTGDKNVFSFYFGNYPGAGELTLGGINSERFTGPIQWVPLNSQTYFQFSSKTWNYKVGTASGSLTPGGLGGFFGANIIADTGSTLLLFNDASIADAINKAIGAGAFDSKNGVYPIDCGIAKTGKDLVLNYGSIPFTIPASIYVFDNFDGTCFSGISQFTQFGAPSIFGDVFLRAYYSIYDKTNNRVGFAKSA